MVELLRTTDARRLRSSLHKSAGAILISRLVSFVVMSVLSPSEYRRISLNAPKGSLPRSKCACDSGRNDHDPMLGSPGSCF